MIEELQYLRLLLEKDLYLQVNAISFLNSDPQPLSWHFSIDILAVFSTYLTYFAHQPVDLELTFFLAISLD